MATDIEYNVNDDKSAGVSGIPRLTDLGVSRAVVALVVAFMCMSIALILFFEYASPSTATRVLSMLVYVATVAVLIGAGYVLIRSNGTITQHHFKKTESTRRNVKDADASVRNSLAMLKLGQVFDAPPAPSEDSAPAKPAQPQFQRPQRSATIPAGGNVTSLKEHANARATR
jgi:hypothetical protein